MGHHTSDKTARSHVIATVKALGGFVVLINRHFKVAYASQLAQEFSVARGDILSNPELLSIAVEASRAKEDTTRICSLADSGPFRDCVAHAGLIGKRWIVLTVLDRTEEVYSTQVRRDLISNIGHELRTPATAVGLIAHALGSCASEPESVLHFAARLSNVAKHLEEVAEGALALVDAQEGSAALHRERISVHALIDRAVARCLEIARGRGIKLRTKVRGDTWVRGNRDNLISALENLIGNAIHYSSKGSKVVVTTQVDEGEKAVMISVIDSGIGISTSDQTRVFERFYRADQARSRRVGGTGLGLSIVKHVVQSHGGSVRVDSRLGYGSTFTMVLPLDTEEPSGPRNTFDNNEKGGRGDD